MLRCEYPQSRLYLVDLEKQLQYAKDFLHTTHELRSIDILSPKDASKIKDIDVVASFGAMCEMTKEYLDYYFRLPFFKSNKFFFHQDRIKKYYGYGYDISIFDYPHNEYDRIFFEVDPLYKFTFNNWMKIYMQPIFTFIGKRK